jgi:hypothetical protein
MVHAKIPGSCAWPLRLVLSSVTLPRYRRRSGGRPGLFGGRDMNKHCSIATSVIAALAAGHADATAARDHATNPVGEIVLNYVGGGVAVTGRACEE